MLKTKPTSCLAGVLLMGSYAPSLGHASDDVDVDRASDRLRQGFRRHDEDTARSEAGVDRAVSIARGTEHVVSVKNNLTVKKDD